MKAYSHDLRSRVIKAYKEGECWSDVCEMYQIAKSTLYEWLKLEKETGSLNARPNTGGKRAKIQNLDEFQKFIDNNPDKTLKEYAELWHEDVSSQSIRTALTKLGYSYKKKALVIKKVPKKKGNNILIN